MASRGRRGEEPREVRISKTMSYILRHGAEKEGIPINKGRLKTPKLEIYYFKNLTIKFKRRLH